MLSVHWTTLFAVFVGLIAVAVAGKVGRQQGDYDFFSPLIGAAVLLIGLVVILGLLLLRASGWV